MDASQLVLRRFCLFAGAFGAAFAGTLAFALDLPFGFARAGVPPPLHLSLGCYTQ